MTNIKDSLLMPMGTTLDRFIMRNQAHFPFATGELSQLLRDIALASKIVNREINRAGLINIAGSVGSQNVQGEDQQKLDVVADVRFTRAITNGGEVCAIISEEHDGMIDTGNHKGKYVMAMDPLDGSSNIDVNVAVGTIFSIYRRLSPIGTAPDLSDVLQKGNRQVAAGYILYGSSTMLVYTTGHGVFGFTYEPSLGEYYLSHSLMKSPENGNIYSCNEANAVTFPGYVNDYLNVLRERGASSRYIGSFVADFHRNLLKGGIYMYPETAKNPSGKLRLMYECNPLAFLIEQAGGTATDGDNRILDLEPKQLHQRCPLYIGSKLMVEELQQHRLLALAADAAKVAEPVVA